MKKLSNVDALLTDKKRDAGFQRVTLSLPPDLVKRFAKVCDKKGIKQSHAVAAMMRDFLEKVEGR